MGYYSDFYLTKPGRFNAPDVLKKLQAIEIEEHYDIYELANNQYTHSKWRNFEQDMCKLSKRFPGVLFQIERHGKVWDDADMNYFMDGLYQCEPARIEFDDFDENKLKPLDNNS